MASKIKINLDTSKEFFLDSKCKQNDDLTLEANIYENGLAKDLTNCSISIQALKADKTYIIQNTDIAKEKNKFIANLVKDFTRVAGKTEIEVVLTESSKQNTTFSFCLNVVGSVIKGAVESSNTVTILEDLQEKTEEARVVKAETEQLIETGGAATKGDIDKVNSSLEQMNTINKENNNVSSLINRTKLEFINLFNGQEDWKKSCWLTPNQEQDDWVFTDDTIKPTYTQLNTHGVNIFNKVKLIQDGEIGVTIKGFDVNSTDNNAVAINFKGKNKADYFTCLLFFNFKEIWLGHMKDGTFYKAKTISYDLEQITPVNGEGINFSVRFIGTRFSVYMNGSALLDGDVSSYFTLRESIGLFGFGIYNGSTKIDTWTKNIIFENPWIKEYKFDILPNKIDKILHVGDSLTFGAGVTTEERWTTLLYNRIKELNKDVKSDNVAVSGSPMEVILNQVVSNILKGYDLVTILGGTNNSRIDDVGTDIETAIVQMQQAIWQCKGNGAIPVVCTCPPIDRTKNSSSVNSQSWAWIIEYNNKVRRLCSKEKIICIDFFNAFKNNLTLLQSDKIHPTAEGHNEMYEIAYNSIFSGGI